MHNNREREEKRRENRRPISHSSFDDLRELVPYTDTRTRVRTERQQKSGCCTHSPSPALLFFLLFSVVIGKRRALGQMFPIFYSLVPLARTPFDVFFPSYFIPFLPPLEKSTRISYSVVCVCVCVCARHYLLFYFYVYIFILVV